MSRMRNNFTQREIWGDPQELSDHELTNAEKWWRSEVERYPQGWAAIDHLNKVLAEKQRRGHQDKLASGIDSLTDELARLRKENADLSGSFGELDNTLRETNERLDDLNRRRRR